MRLTSCGNCGRKLMDWPEVKAVLTCTCGHVVSAPSDPVGPGSRAAPGDIRFEGTRAERDDANELGHT